MYFPLCTDLCVFVFIIKKKKNTKKTTSFSLVQETLINKCSGIPKWTSVTLTYCTKLFCEGRGSICPSISTLSFTVFLRLEITLQKQTFLQSFDISAGVFCKPCLVFSFFMYTHFCSWSELCSTFTTHDSSIRPGQMTTRVFRNTFTGFLMFGPMKVVETEGWLKQTVFV